MITQHLPDQIGQYHILGQLGEGGMATVYLAYHGIDGHTFAVKVPHTHIVKNAQNLERFYREMEIAIELDHPHIVKTHEINDRDYSVPFIVMQYLRGGTLQNKIRFQRNGKPSLGVHQTLNIITAIADALRYAHTQKGLVHRDIKPSNILFDEYGSPYLADFGIAKALAQAGITQNERLGTKEYMAYEQWANSAKVNDKADQYSLAVIAYELLAGNLPFDERLHQDGLDLWPRISPQISFHRKGLSSYVDQVFFQALSRTPESRFQDVNQFAAALRRVVEDSPIFRTETSELPAVNSVYQSDPTLSDVIAAAINAAPVLSDDIGHEEYGLDPNWPTPASPVDLEPIPDDTPAADLEAPESHESVLSDGFYPDALIAGEGDDPRAEATIILPPHVEDLRDVSPLGDALSNGDIYQTIKIPRGIAVVSSSDVTPSVPSVSPPVIIKRPRLTPVILGSFVVLLLVIFLFRESETDERIISTPQTPVLTQTLTLVPNDISGLVSSAGITPTDLTGLETTPNQTPTLTLTPSLTPTLTFTPTPTPSDGEMALWLATQKCVTRNEEWLPYVGIEGVTARVINGVEMVLVPCGAFIMGSLPTEVEPAIAQCNALGTIADCEARFTHENPVQLITFKQPFWIDKTEVTQASFAASGTLLSGNFPQTNVMWEAAWQHCHDRGEGVRLPSEAEWEYAARGGSRWLYPWGNQFESARLNHAKDITEKDVAAANSYWAGLSWIGALNLLGNVAEWTNSLYKLYPFDPHDGREDYAVAENFRVVRGGDFRSNLYEVRSAARSRVAATFQSNYIGFRCVMDYTE